VHLLIERPFLTRFDQQIDRPVELAVLAVGDLHGEDHRGVPGLAFMEDLQQVDGSTHVAFLQEAHRAAQVSVRAGQLAPGERVEALTVRRRLVDPSQALQE